MNPSDAHSSLAALRQLKEMLDAGTITPTEFETLKRQIVFGQEPALPLEPVAEGPTRPVPAQTTQPPLATYETPAAYPPAEEVDENVTPPINQPAAADWLAAPAPSLLHASDMDTDTPPEEERRNPLNLIFALGGLLVFLGVIAYLMIGRPSAPDEHLTSASQTAADSTAVVPEVGPQAEQVAPVTQPMPAQAASQFRTDSAAAPVAAPRATKAPAVAPAAGTTVVTDSSSTTQAP
jgi:hypothetical protein